ncbi:hypothetical protein MKW94_002674 [Papaver nudicaule]|uniref:Uncharacterized protein n=1 Tax=Papaver nudicaule TaxID=74823 RepID=A0AA41SFB6_PAPNU|nr:hypothetical protein [Papaver nudicaule]
MEFCEMVKMYGNIDRNVRDESAVFCGEWEDGWYDTDDDEKQESEVSGTSMDSQLISHGGGKIDTGIKDDDSAEKSSEKHMSVGDVEPIEEDKLAANKATNGDASEEGMSTEMKKNKEKRKSQEDGVKLEQNDCIGIAIEVMKKNKSVSISDV